MTEPKQYRCTREPTSKTDFGAWEVFINGKWRKVINYGILKNLNDGRIESVEANPPEKKGQD